LSVTQNTACSGVPPEPPCFFDDPSGCPSIDVGEDIVLPTCYSPCESVELEAAVFETGLTTSYEVCAINYNPPYPFNSGTPFSVGVDDVWTGVINLPFNFCFYGNIYSQAVVGSNGLISFNTAYANGFCPWSFTASIPNAILPLNAIFGPYHDIDPSICGDAKYAILGTEPCRAFVVSFDNICQFDCNNLISSHQIVIYETTNVIEVYTEAKPTCNSWNFGNAVIGIQNASGSIGVVAPGRQTGAWTATNEAWRFTPSGAANFEVDWYEGQTYIGSGITVEVCPEEPSHNYIGIASYTNCDGGVVQVFDDVNVVCSQIMLPVELSSFSAEPEASRVRCRWRTETEWNSHFFTVEQSADLLQWKQIGQTPASGFTQEPRDYSFVDESPLNGISYYRLKTTDFDGFTDVSEIEVVEFVETNSVSLIVIPNPNAGQFGLRIDPEKVRIRIVDLRGSEVPWEWMDKRSIALRSPAAGTYILEITEIEEGLMRRERFVVED
jgi:hypothetical protein